MRRPVSTKRRSSNTDIQYVPHPDRKQRNTAVLFRELKDDPVFRFIHPPDPPRRFPERPSGFSWIGHKISNRDLRFFDQGYSGLHAVYNPALPFHPLKVPVFLLSALRSPLSHPHILSARRTARTEPPGQRQAYGDVSVIHDAAAR